MTKTNGFKGTIHLLDKEDLEKRLLKHIYASAKNCCSLLGAKYFFDEAEEKLKTEKGKEQVISFCKTLIKNKHRTTLTHTLFSFSIENASRSCVDQMVRSQVGTNFDVVSQRYVKFTKNEELFSMPWNVHLEDEDYLNDLPEDLRGKLKEHQKSTKEIYKGLIEAGKPAEEARWVLPMDMPTSLMATYNIVSFKHFLDTRLNHKTGVSQSEIEELAFKMREEFVNSVPFMRDLYFSG